MRTRFWSHAVGHGGVGSAFSHARKKFQIGIGNDDEPGRTALLLLRIPHLAQGATALQYQIRPHKLMHFYYSMDEWELYNLDDDPHN